MSILTRVPRAVYDNNRAAFDGFEPEGGFRIGSARGMAWLSQLAYETENPAKVAEVLASWDLSLIGEVIARHDRVALPTAMTYGFVAQGRGATVVAFAGTDPVLPANWTTNFDVALATDGSARGFSEAAAIARDDVLDRLGASVAGHRLFITGHSLGGALGVITAPALIQQGRAVEGVYTFGMPRPGNAAFAAAYNASLGMRTWRLVYGDDLVATVAPSAMGFRHVGRHLRCPRFGRFQDSMPAADPGSDEPLFTDGVRQDWADALDRIAHPLNAIAEQVGPAVRILFGVGPDGLRSDAIAAMIELLPPRVRDHIPDRYCAALA
jgi:triacylglycerol lipase